MATKKECAKLQEQLRILGLQQERLEDEMLEATILAEQNGLEAQSVKEQWQTTLLTRVPTPVLNKSLYVATHCTVII